MPSQRTSCIIKMSDQKTSRPRFLNVTQGQYKVSSEEEIGLTTILGSCVAACIYDPVAKIGGLNHFLLPGERYQESTSLSYGVNAMELLINDMQKKGASRSRFQAKLFGGAEMVAGLSDAGAQNAKFALEFLDMEGIPCLAKSLGGTCARRVRFWPASGRAQLRILSNDSEEISKVRPARKAVHLSKPVKSAAGQIELF